MSIEKFTTKTEKEENFKEYFGNKFIKLMNEIGEQRQFMEYENVADKKSWNFLLFLTAINKLANDPKMPRGIGEKLSQTTEWINLHWSMPEENYQHHDSLNSEDQVIMDLEKTSLRDSQIKLIKEMEAILPEKLINELKSYID